MLITKGNFDKYFYSEKHINVPHKEIFTTLGFHAFLMFAIQVLFYNVFAVVAVILFVIEAYYIYAVLYKMWKKVGYSGKLFFVGWFVYLAVSFFLAYLLRECILGLF